MTVMQGDLRKMAVQHHDPVDYYLALDNQQYHLNPLIGQPISLTSTGEIHCVQCGRKTSKSFQQGFCFPCMRRINECGNCIIHPERCLVEQGGCPQDDWAHAHCDADQMVYLSNTSGLKVGVTRQTQVPTRWIDQGAMQAIPLFFTSNRYQAGLIEVALKAFVKDKTNWRTMLKQDSIAMNMTLERDRILQQASDVLAPIVMKYPNFIRPILDNAVDIRFPLGDYPEKVSSLSLEKTPAIEGRLLGIKGQYLILDIGVLNIRKFSGYRVNVKLG